MRKYILIFAVFLLSITLLGVRANSVLGANCASGDLFDTSTGRPCSTDTVVECRTGDKFNTQTGQACTKWKDSTTTYSQDLKIGSRGEAVKIFQQKLKDTGFLTGKVDGIYGPITDKAAKAYYQKYPSSVGIYPIPRCPLVYNSDGTIVHSCPEYDSNVRVDSPNGGETLVKGEKETIKWTNIASVFNCVTTPCPQPPIPAQKYYDINLLSNDSSCTRDVCTNVSRPAYTIAKKVFDDSYEWLVGKTLAPTSSSVPDGAYLIQVCETGSSNCDISDSYFKITTKDVIPTYNGSLYLKPDTATLKVGGTIEMQAIYQPPMPPCPIGMACTLAMPAPYPVRAVWTSNNSKIASVGYKDICPNSTYCRFVDRNDYETAVITGISKGDALITASYKEASATVSSSINASAKVSVLDSSVTRAPKILSISPSSGIVGSKVKLTGSGFTRSGNKIKFGNLGSEENGEYNLSSDGTSLIFTVPTTNYHSCWDSVPACKIAAVSTTPGKYEVSVINANGTSNTVVFTVTSTPIAMCDYAAPPQGCSYVPGPSYDPNTQCGLELKCDAGLEEKVLGAQAFKFTLTLRKGSSGAEVTELQKFLSKLGYYAGSVDGNFGTQTESAVIKLQTANGLYADGIVGPMVRAILNK